MLKRVFTGSYKNCKVGNLISISGDRGKSVGFNGKAMPALAPKKAFWVIWHNNIGKIPEEENARYYIEEYYKQVLLKVNFEELFKDEKDPILLCFEESSEFCHRHIVAEYLQIKYGIKVYEITISSDLEIKEMERPENIRRILLEVIEKYKSEIVSIDER